MKNFIIKTLMVILPVESITESIIITLPDNAIPIDMEVRPANYPQGLFLHHLIPCGKNGNPIEEITTPNVYGAAWNELYKCFGEKMQQEELNLMDSVLTGVTLDLEDETKMHNGEGK